MLGILSVIMIIALSILVTRIATIALTLTGLSREAARFQARSAFTGVGFTTAEAEHVVSHPVRRRIIMLLMLFGSAGVVTVIASLIVGFAGSEEGDPTWITRLLVLTLGIGGLWLLASSRWVDRGLSAVIRRALRRFSSLNVQDYAEILHVSEDYRVRKLAVREDDWMEGRTLRDLSLHAEGFNILGIERANGDYIGAPHGDTRIEAGDVLVIYGRRSALQRLEGRPKGTAGQQAHREGVVEQQQVVQREASRGLERSRHAVR